LGAVKKAAELSNEVSETKEEKAATLKEIEDLYSSLKNNAEKYALKRGLARSSIITERLSEYDKNHAGSASEITLSYDKSIAEINDQIDGLESEKEKSLDELNLSYATDITK
jgi:hypothetical protein